MEASACKPLQHIIGRLSFPEASCGGNNGNGFNSNSLKLEDLEPKRRKKVENVIKKVVRKEVKKVRVAKEVVQKEETPWTNRRYSPILCTAGATICEKYVSIETLPDLPDVICNECKNGFVETFGVAPTPPEPRNANQIDERSLAYAFTQRLRHIVQSPSDDEEPPSPPPNHASEDDFLRIELDGWDNDEDEDVNENDGEGEDQEEEDRSDNENEENVYRPEMDRELLQRRHKMLCRCIRNLAAHASGNRNAILDWAILMASEDSTIEFHFQMPEPEGYTGNPEDYVDATGYEELLQNLAESDGVARRGARPASKSAISALPSIEIKSEE